MQVGIFEDTRLTFWFQAEPGEREWAVETGEVDSETYARWLRIASEWEALQIELRALSSQWSREKFMRGQT